MLLEENNRDFPPLNSSTHLVSRTNLVSKTKKAVQQIEILFLYTKKEHLSFYYKCSAPPQQRTVVFYYSAFIFEN